MKVTIFAATEGDVLYVAEHLRGADRRELETASGLSARDAVLRGWRLSELTFTACIENKPAIVFGVAQGGVIWLVGTDAISKATLEIFRLSKQIVRGLLQLYPRLHNQADCRNTLHLCWLQLIGFTFDEKVELNGSEFQRFHMQREEAPSV